MAAMNSADTVLEETRAKEKEIKEPPQYKVIMLNDNVTSMDFVVDLLCGIFGMGHEKAVKVMLQIHHEGKGICGIYTKEIADAKVARVRREASQANFPLRCIAEKN